MENYWEERFVMGRTGIESWCLHMLSLRCLWNPQVELLNLSLGFREVGAGEKHLGDVSLSMVIKAVGKE